MRITVALLLALALAACARTSGQPLAIAQKPGGAIFYVERHERDSRNLAGTIAEALRARGLEASSGSYAERPADIDYRVTYEDRWQWDMRMYLIDLRVNIVDPDTARVIAFGESYQDSLAAMGKTHLDIVKRALDEIFSPRQ